VSINATGPAPWLSAITPKCPAMVVLAYTALLTRNN
jgi:hypothetical protein